MTEKKKARVYFPKMEKGLFLAAVEGISKGLDAGVKSYLEWGIYREGVDFSPIFSEQDGKLFLAGNIYFPEVCTFVAYQYPGRENKTSISCHGSTGEITLDFLKGFMGALEFVCREPSEELKREVREAHGPLEAIWFSVLGNGRDEQKLLLATSLMLQNKRYKEQARAVYSRKSAMVN